MLRDAGLDSLDEGRERAVLYRFGYFNNPEKREINREEDRPPVGKLGKVASDLVHQGRAVLFLLGPGGVDDNQPLDIG